MNDLWYGTSGPPDAEIVLVGESWGLEESQAKRPFVGSSGTELTRILAEAGLDRSKILLTNVIADRPQNNETWRYFHGKEVPSGHSLSLEAAILLSSFVKSSALSAD
jgi:uracil-DNA glycosylase family 4